MGDRRRLLAALALLAGVVTVLAPAAPADAHATAVAAWPAPGQVLASAPDRLTVEFSTEVEPQLQLAVVGPDGRSLAVGAPVVDGRFVTQELHPTRQTGAFVAAVHAVGVDLHPVIARIDFRVDPAATATVNPAGDPPSLTAAATPPVVRDAGRSPVPWLVLGAAVLGAVAVLHRVAARHRVRATGLGGTP